MNKKEKQQIKYLLENLKWYAEAPNEQDYNGEYEPPMEWEQGETKVFLKYLEEQNKEIEKLNKEKVDLFNKAVKLNLEIRENKDKEIERLNNIINKIDTYANKLRYYADEDDEGYKISKDIHNIIQELKGSDKE